MYIIDSDPVCTSEGPSNPQGIVLENDTVTYLCQIRYQGRWGPIQIWSDKDGIEIPYNIGDDSVEGSILHTYVTFPAKSSDDGQKLMCQTKFGALTPPPGENEDTTLPSYDNNNTFQTLIVHCKHSKFILVLICMYNLYYSILICKLTLVLIYFYIICI